jgi:hypothetical protein
MQEIYIQQTHYKALFYIFFRWHRTSNPHKLVGIDRNGKLVGEPRPVELVRVPLLAWYLSGFVCAAIDAVNRDDEDFVVVSKVFPNNLE